MNRMIPQGSYTMEMIRRRQAGILLSVLYCTTAILETIRNQYCFYSKIHWDRTPAFRILEWRSAGSRLGLFCLFYFSCNSGNDTLSHLACPRICFDKKALGRQADRKCLGAIAQHSWYHEWTSSWQVGWFSFLYFSSKNWRRKNEKWCLIICPFTRGEMINAIINNFARRSFDFIDGAGHVCDANLNRGVKRTGTNYSRCGS
jgi:hypothetical protein